MGGDTRVKSPPFKLITWWGPCHFMTTTVRKLIPNTCQNLRCASPANKMTIRNNRYFAPSPVWINRMKNSLSAMLTKQKCFFKKLIMQMIQLMIRALVILKSNRRARSKPLRKTNLVVSSRRDLAISAVLKVFMDPNPCSHKSLYFSFKL